jgi:hypothetical protein
MAISTYMMKMSYFAAITSNINADAEMGILRVTSFHHDTQLHLNETTKSMHIINLHVTRWRQYRDLNLSII